MKFTAIILSARFWLMLMLSATLGFGTAAADIHPEDASEIACTNIDGQTEHEIVINDANNDDGEKRPSHKHHTHHCGPCHLHVVGTYGTIFTYHLSSSIALRPGANQYVPRAGPSGLYRPPRV